MTEGRERKFQYLKNTNIEAAELRAAPCYSYNPVITNLVATADIQVSQGATSTNSNEGFISHPGIGKRKLEVPETHSCFGTLLPMK